MSEHNGATTKPKKRLTRRTLLARRKFLRTIGAGFAIVGAAVIGVYPVLKRVFERLRPPGALEEHAFLAACIKCGQCVQVCPVKAIKLGDGEDGYGLGVPFIDAREQACDFSCDAVQCVLSCPTGALTHSIATKEEVRIGFARVARPQHCLAMQGLPFKGAARPPEYEGLHRYVEIDRWEPLRISEHQYDVDLCDLCVRECPIEGAITLEPFSRDLGDKRRIPTIHETCVGCGTCEMVCPVQPQPAIIIDPSITLARLA